MTDFDPGFSLFDGLAGQASKQSPWEFAGALQQARLEGPASKGTSIDYKIQQRLGAKQRAAAERRAGRPQRAAADGDAAAAEDSSDDEELGGGSGASDGDEAGESAEEFEDDEDEDRAAAGGDSDSSDATDGGESSESEPELAWEAKRRVPRSAAAATAAEPAAKRRKQDGGGTAAAVPAPAARQKQPPQPPPQQPANGFYGAAPEGTRFAAPSFAALHLSRPLVRACDALGYAAPTPIQAAVVPLALTGRDICGSAVTGSGKTAAFALPLLERLLHRDRRVAATYALVLAPTRELAVQVHSMVARLAQFTDVRAALVVGGLSLAAQAAALRAAPEVVVATPGRLIDHLRNSQSVGLEDLQCLVLDEADRLLEMGFAEEVGQIVRAAPRSRQTLLFSATMTEEVRALAALSLRHPVRLAADAAAATPAALAQEVVRLRGEAAAQKEALLLALCARSLRGGRAIVFFRTKQRAHRAKIVFGLAGLPPAAELHGDMTQAARLEALERFRAGGAAFLLATDVAARGLDILGVEAVVNFDCPPSLASYLHRVGRTARAGSRGRAITLAEDGDRALLREVVRRAGAALAARAVPPAAVRRWQARLEALAPAVEGVLAEEREERALRRAEMEAAKAANMLEHGDEIYSRPARTWFQTEAQKRAAAAGARRAAEGGGAAAADADGPTPAEGKAKKALDKSARRQGRKAAAAAEAAADRRGRGRLMEDTAGASRGIRAVKAAEARLRQQGVPAARAGKMAAAQVSGVKPKRQQQQKRAQGSGQGGELFAGDGLGGGKVYAGGARSGKVRAPPKPGGAAKPGAKGKGRHAFKSKARHRGRLRKR